MKSHLVLGAALTYTQGGQTDRQPARHTTPGNTHLPTYKIGKCLTARICCDERGYVCLRLHRSNVMFPVTIFAHVLSNVDHRLPIQFAWLNYMALNDTQHFGRLNQIKAGRYSVSTKNNGTS